MKIRRMFSLLLSILIMVITVVETPLNLMVVQASVVSEVEDITIENNSDELEEEVYAQEGTEDEFRESDNVDDEVIDDEEVADEEIADEETNDEETNDEEIGDDDDEYSDGEDGDAIGGGIIGGGGAIGGGPGDRMTGAPIGVTPAEEIEEEASDSDDGEPRTPRAPGDIVINTTNFPDSMFQFYLRTRNWKPLHKIDVNGDGILSVAERNAVTIIDVSEMGITSLKGIEHFPNLTILIAYDNRLSSIDVSKNTKLTTLSVSYNALTTLNVTNNRDLLSLTCNNNNLGSLNLNNNTKLVSLTCNNNNLSSLDLSNNGQLGEIHCQKNSLTTLTLGTNANLEYLDCSGNRLTTLNINSTPNLAVLDCSNNQLTGLNTSNNRGLSALLCNNNRIGSLNLSANTNLIQILCANNRLSNLEIPNSVSLHLEYLELENQTGMAAYNIATQATNDNAMNVSWNAISGATGYELYRYDKSFNNWERVDTREITGTSYKDTKVRLSETYDYKLYAYQKNATTKRYFAYASTTVPRRVTITAPQNVKTTIASANSINVTWNRVDRAAGYTVYAATSRNGKYTNIGSVTGTSIRHTGLKVGTTYYYKVRTYSLLGPNIAYSSDSAIASRKQIVPKVTGVKVANRSANSQRISWKKVNNASGYEVYQATSKNGKYKKIATIKKNSTVSFTAKKLANKKTYHYKVRAYRNVDGKKRNGAFSNIVKRKVVLAKPALTAKTRNKTSINLSWKKVDGAQQYEIYRATKKNGKYTKIATTKSRKYTSNKLKRNTQYFYRIRAVQKIGNKTYRSSFSAKVSARTKK